MSGIDLPDIYKTGNKGMDDKIAKALAKGRLGVEERFNFVSSEKQNKYHVSEKEDRTYRDGTVFASKGEMERWEYLLMLQRGGEIKHLQRQIPFILQKEFRHPQWGLIPAMTYVADFVYTNISFRKEYPNRLCVEDSKGKWLTDIYKLKKKLFLFRHRHNTLLFFEV